MRERKEVQAVAIRRHTEPKSKVRSVAIRRLTRHALAVLLGLFVLTGCDVETSGNGDLDGMWRLTAVDTLQTGGRLELNEELRAWSFQNKLLELRDHTGPTGAFLLRFEHKNKTLRTYQPYVFNREEGDYPLENAAYMAPFGLNHLDETFTIEELSGARMTLKGEELQLSFRKLN